MLLQLLKPLILVILAGDICAETAEICKLLLHVFCRGLNIGFDSLEVFLMIHLRSRISNDLDTFW